MPGSDAELNVVLRFRNQMTRGLRSSRRQVERFARTATRAFRRVAFAVRGLKRALFGLPGLVAGVGTLGFAAISRDMVRAASMAEEIRNRFRVAFGGIADDAEDMAQSFSKSLGRSVTQTRGNMADFAAFLESVGFSGPAVLDTAQALNALTTDLASFQDVSDARASKALKSALVGEAEALKRLNIFVTEAKVDMEAYELGIRASGRELTEQQKVLGRLQIILNSNTLAHGDAIRTYDAFANVVRRMSSQLLALRELYGAKLIDAIGETTRAIGGEGVVLDVVSASLAFVAAMTIEVIKVIGDLIFTARKAIEELGGMAESLKLVGVAASLFADMLSILVNSTLVMAKAFRTFIRVMDFFVTGTVSGLRLLGMVYTMLSKKVAMLANTILISLVGAAEDASDLFRNLLPNAMLLFAEAIRGVMDELEDLRDVGLWGIGEGVSDVISALDLAQTGLTGLASTFERRPPMEFLTTLRRGLEETGAEMERTVNRLDTSINVLTGKMGGDRKSIVLQLTKDMLELAPAMMAVRDSLAAAGPKASELTAAADLLLSRIKTIKAEGDFLPPGKTAEDLAKAIELLKTDIRELLAQIPDDNALSKALADWAEAMPSLQVAMNDLVINGIEDFADGMGRAFADFATGAKTAKEAFSDFARSFLADITQMIIKTLILNAISNAFGSGSTSASSGGSGGGALTNTGGGAVMSPTFLANGGVMGGGLSGAVPLHGYANGGPVFRTPHIGVIGEGRYNEAAVPLPDGRSIPVDLRGGGGANIVFQIQMIDARGVDQLLTERRRTIEDVVANGMTTRRGFRSNMKGSFS